MVKCAIFLVVILSTSGGLGLFRLPRLAGIKDGLRTLNATLSLLGHCLTSRGYSDASLGDVGLGRTTYCSLRMPRTLRQIPRVTCCAPMSPEAMAIKLILHQSGQEPVEIDWRNPEEASQLGSGPVAILIHGWLEDTEEPHYVLLRNSLIEQGHAVVSVDWTGGNRPHYFQSAANIRTVGQVAGHAVFAWDIADRSLAIGHSLGAQALGEMGKYVKSKGQLVKKCIGSDPAGPGFDGGPDYIRLTKDDCELVQVVHSSALEKMFATSPRLNQIGTMFKSGHCDYWLNCGHHQPGCKQLDFSLPEILGFIAKQIQTGGRMGLGGLSCSHRRGIAFLAISSAQQCQFQAANCVGCGQPKVECSMEQAEGAGVPLAIDHGCTPDMDVDILITDEGCSALR
ncbi:putative phospholipase A1 magnifin [Halotydeus destructor]|nr:putative phospholipase A1 magnifin [Halotydeus destructor]